MLDSSDADKFKTVVEKLVQTFPQITGKSSGPVTREGWKPGEGGRSSAAPDHIAAAFKPKI